MAKPSTLVWLLVNTTPPKKTAAKKRDFIAKRDKGIFLRVKPGQGGRDT
jgi:hypothetical protein